MLGCEARRNPFMMFRKWIIAAVAVALIGPAWLTAQQPPRPPAPPRPPRQPRAFVFADDNRGRIGVVVKTQPDSEADKLGAKLEGVTPGGPAAKAGLRVGDIITKFNGTALAGLKVEDEEESGPGTKLVQLARKLEPGETVSIELMRKQKRLTVAWKVPEPEARHMRRSRGHEEQSHYRRVVRGVRTPLGARWV